MQKNSTPSQNLISSRLIQGKSQSTPRRSTIDFLKQFARAYHFEPQMKASLGGMVMN